MRVLVNLLVILLIAIIAVLGYIIYQSKPDRPMISHEDTYVYEPYKDEKYRQWITNARNKLTDAADAGTGSGVSDSTGLMILNRYNQYLDEIRNNNAFVTYDSQKVSGIYLYYAFISMMKEEVINQITENTLAGRDGLSGMTGLFERPYNSKYDGALDSYIIYLPKDYDPAKCYPLVVVLHGYGTGAYIERTATENDAFMNRCESRDIIMVCPNGRHKLPDQNGCYTGDSMEDVLQVIEDTKTHYTIDEKRIYLTGFSMGGFGTWYIASKHPELFAAIAPLCGYRNSYGPEGLSVDMESLRNMPVYAFHGDSDRTVPCLATASMVQELKDLGGNVAYLELKGYGHNIWDHVYEEMDLPGWFLQWTKE